MLRVYVFRSSWSIPRCRTEKHFERHRATSVASAGRGVKNPRGGYGSACLVQCFRKGAMVSIGMGKMVVEFFSAAISTRVCR